MKTLGELVADFASTKGPTSGTDRLATITVDNGYASANLFADLHQHGCAGLGVLGSRRRCAFDVVTYKPAPGCPVAEVEPSQLVAAQRTFHGAARAYPRATCLGRWV